jgi:hypothetical protein
MSLPLAVSSLDVVHFLMATILNPLPPTRRPSRPWPMSQPPSRVCQLPRVLSQPASAFPSLFLPAERRLFSFLFLAVCDRSVTLTLFILFVLLINHAVFLDKLISVFCLNTILLSHTPSFHVNQSHQNALSNWYLSSVPLHYLPMLTLPQNSAPTIAPTARLPIASARSRF